MPACWRARPSRCRAAGRAARGELAAQDTSFAIRHGLYWLIGHLAAGQPVLIIVDDAHWADEPSLRWLAYLATRLDGLGAALLVALRPAEAASRAGPLLAVRAAAAAIRPAVLTGDGVAVLARAALGEGVPGDQCAALRAASGGNPFYLSELLGHARGVRRHAGWPSNPGHIGYHGQPGRNRRLGRAADRPGQRAPATSATGDPAGRRRPGGQRLDAGAAGQVARHVEARIRRLDPGGGRPGPGAGGAR